MFCFCGNPQDQNQKSQNVISNSQITSLQTQMLLNQANNQRCTQPYFSDQCILLNDNDSTAREYLEFKSEYNKLFQDKCHIEQNDEKMASKVEEFKMCSNENKLRHLGDGLLVRSLSINQSTIRKMKDTYFLMQNAYTTQKIRQQKIAPKQEVQFIKQLVPNIITELTYQRIKNDKLLIAHDPTGSFLLKHISSSLVVYFVEESKMFRPIIERGVSVLHCDNKIKYIIKSDIQEKLDTAIVNLLFHPDIPIHSLIAEYLALSHDLILILSPKLEYHEMISQLRQGIKNSVQSKLNCGIELQSVYIENTLIAYIVYYGEVSLINQNQQLRFLYNCISKNMQKTFKYKPFLKNLRSIIGIMQLVDQFSIYGLLNDNSDENFKKFFKQMKNQYFPTIKSQRYIQIESEKSLTESENEEGSLQLESTNDLITEFKIYSKSESLYSNTYNYVHFHSQNNRKSQHQEDYSSIIQ